MEVGARGREVGTVYPLFTPSLMVEETGVPGKKLPTFHKSLTNVMTMLYRVHLAMNGIQTHNFDCIGSCKSKYHTTTAHTLTDSLAHGVV